MTFRRLILSLAILIFGALSVKGQLTAWKFKFPMMVKNDDGKTRTNYVFKLNINTQALVSSGNLDITGKDLRFSSDCNGNSLLNFWIEKDFNTTNTIVWIFLEKLSANEKKVIYLFGKNAAAAPASNFNATFVSQLIIDAANTSFQSIKDSIWKYNYIEIKAGVTSQFASTASNGTPSKLTLEASKIVISGTLSANGAGHPGVLASNGKGPGAGYAAPATGFAGGGAGHGGLGGRSSYTGAISTSGSGGSVYGQLNDQSALPGSSGGASGILTTGKPGGNGGGSFILIAEDIQVTGKITTNGSNGSAGLSGCSGGGSGGTIVFNAKDITLTGEVSSRGGNGGGPSLPGYPGGGGGGGYIKFFYQTSFANSALTSVNGGSAGLNNCCTSPENGRNGQTYLEKSGQLKASMSNYAALPLMAEQTLPVCQGTDLNITNQPGFIQYDYYKNEQLVHTGGPTFTIPANNGDRIVVGMYTAPGCFVSSDTLYVTTYATAVITLNTGASKAICDGDSHTLIASSTTPGVYQWEKDGSSIPNANSPTYTATSAGNYTVMLTTSELCKSTSSPVKIIINETPVISAISGSFHICTRDSFQAVAAATLPGTFQWYLDEVPDQPGNEIFAKKAGTYYCQITTAQNCKGKTEPLTIILDALPNPLIDTSQFGGTICGNNSSIVLSTDQDYWSYKWTRNGAVQNFGGKDFEIGLEGSYVVEVTDMIGCRNSSATMIIKKMGPFESVSAPTNIICSNDSVLMGNPNINGYGVSWTLDGVDLQLKTPTIYAKAMGTYTYTVSNGAQCSLTYASVVSHRQAPSGLLNTEKDTTFCEGSTYKLSISTATTTISWFNNSSQVALNVDNINPYNSGIYYAVLTDNGCTFTTPKVKVTVIPIPATPIFTLRFDSLISYFPTGNQWLLNGQAIPGANGRVYHIQENGEYSLINLGTAGCQSDTSTSISFRSTGINTTESFAAEVFPNPTAGEFNIVLPGEFEYELIDMSGRQLISGHASNSKSLNIHDLSSSVYLLRITQNGNNSITRISKTE